MINIIKKYCCTHRHNSDSNSENIIIKSVSSVSIISNSSSIGSIGTVSECSNSSKNDYIIVLDNVLTKQQYMDMDIGKNICNHNNSIFTFGIL